MGLPQYRRSGKLWYVSDGFIWDELPAEYRTETGRPLECSSKLLIFNPQRKTARVRARFFHVDRPPTATELRVGPGRIETLELAGVSEVPHKQAFWIEVRSDVPVLPQACHEDYTFWDPVPDALVSVAPYPGPLKDETRWVFPDCWQGKVRSWHERELLTILNPRKRPVSARVRYLHRLWEGGGEERIEIPGERVVAIDCWDHGPRLLGSNSGPPVKLRGEFAVRIDASGPVIAQSTRRARWKGRPSIIGARSTMGFPLRGRGPKRWFYPAGDIIDRGVLPRGKNCDVTWNLLFTNNLDEKRQARATVRFSYGDGSSTLSRPLVIPPTKSVIEWLHLAPWLGKHTHVARPYAMTVTGDRPIAVEVTCAEFEMWSQVCPGAMTAVNGYPAPLTDERSWWLGIGHAGGKDAENVEWSQSYHLFNPGRHAVRAHLRFLGLSGRRKTLNHAVEIGPGAVARVDAAEVKGLPVGRPFAVRAEGDGPFCAQVWVRAFTRGLPHTRSMYSFIGVPMKLAP